MPRPAQEGTPGATVSYIPFVVGAGGHPVFCSTAFVSPRTLSCASASRVMLHGDFSRFWLR